MSLPFSQQEVTWRLAVNGNYQDVMRTFMNLVTASLVLPLFLVRNFLGVPEGQPITNYLRPSAYLSWGSLFLSLLCGMGFFLASAKYVKLVYGGTNYTSLRVLSSDAYFSARALRHRAFHSPFRADLQVENLA